MSKFFFAYCISLLLCFFTISLNAQRISLNEGISLKKAFKKIEKLSDYTFFYSDDEINTREVLNASIEEELVAVLEILSNQFSFEFQIDRNRIILKQIEFESFIVSGKVKDFQNNPLVGVNVYAEKSKAGTITNADGFYSLALTNEKVLSFSFIGFKDQSISIFSDTTLNIKLEEDVTSINEVVIVAYGKEDKDLMTGSITTLNLRDQNVEGNESLTKSLQAVSTGVFVQSNAGTPGSSVNVKLRGLGSINAGNQPLYIIDGVPLVTGNYSQIEFGGQLLDAISDFNVSDIETITVLKDGASSSLYGSRASNGVILINTTLDKDIKSKISFSSSFGWREAPKKLDLLNASEWMTVVNEEALSDGLPEVYSQQQIANPLVDTDWLDEVFKKAFFENYQLSFQGSNDGSAYFISAHLRSDDGIVIGTSQKSYGVRLNYLKNITEKFELIVRTYNHKSKIERIEADQSLNGPLPNAISLSPIDPVYNDDGSYYNDGIYANPLSIAFEEKNTASIFRSFNVFELNYSFTENFKISSLSGFDYYHLLEESFAPNTTRLGSKYNGYGIEANGIVEYLSNNTYLTYEKNLNSNNFKLTSGFNIENIKEHFNYLRVQDFPGSDIQHLDAGATPIISRSYSEDSRLQSIFGRLNYNFDKKYFVSINTRLDGSSKFGKDNRYGFFPSLSGMWYLSKEPFLNNSALLDYLKIKASFGQVGNDRIGNYLNYDLFQTGDNYNNQPGISPYQLQNSALKWETTTHYNFGFDVGIFKNLNLVIDAYYKLTTDLLLEKPMPPSLGYDYVLSNIGKVENMGLEFELNYFKRMQEVVWNSKFLFSSYKNNVLELYEDTPIRNIGRAMSSIEVGQPISFFYGYNVLGVDTQTGNLIYEDIDKDDQITSSDKKRIGSPHPNFFGGFENKLSYKNFELSILLSYMYGNDIFNGTKFYGESFSDQGNMLATVLDRWKEPGNNTEVPRFSSENELISSRYIEDGSYIRVKQLQLSYSFNELFEKRIQKLEIYLSFENLYTWTNYSGMDPEINYNGNNSIRMGTDFFTCPQPRTFLFGLCVNF